MKRLISFALFLILSPCANAAPRKPEYKGPNPLVRAASMGDVALIRRLARAGADPNASGQGFERPLGVALKKHRFGTADVLISLGANFSRSQNAVFDAVDDADLPSLAYILKRGVKPNSFFDAAGFSLITSCIAMSVMDDASDHVTEDRTKTIQMLLEAGADPNLMDKQGSGAMQDAAQKASLPLLKLLLRFGGDVNKPDHDGDTPLILNVAPPSAGPDNANDSHERRAVRLLLLEKGADVHARNKRGTTPIHLAAAHNFVTALQDLVANGADINARGWNNTTPLHTAMRYGSVKVAEKLLVLNADSSLRDVTLRSALDFQNATSYSPDWELNGASEASYALSAEEVRPLRAQIALLIQESRLSKTGVEGK